MENSGYVSYEMFGAKGDGVTDDGLAVQKAHEYANEHGLRVVTNPTATYYFGRKTHTAVIKTDVDFGTSKFIIDDSEVTVEERGEPIFCVASDKKSYEITLDRLQKNQARLPMEFPEQSFITVYNSGKKQFVRTGGNQGSGSEQMDSFIVDSTGYILNPVIWDFAAVTKAVVCPIDEKILTVRGGIFTVIANQAESEYNYYQRNIMVNRSNTVIEKLTMYVEGEKDHGAPYSNFVSVNGCVNFTLKDSFLTPRKTYYTVGSAGTAVPMGSYSIGAYNVIGFRLYNVRQKNIMDRAYWGIMGTNHCKDILLDGCCLSRFDSHENVTNLTVKNSILGHMGLNAIGHGRLLVENLTVYNYYFIHFRGDYGSTWDGDAYFKDVRWYPTGEPAVFIHAHSYTGEHDYGYPCMLPRNITIENLHICDSDVSKEYSGAKLFYMKGDTYNTGKNLDFDNKKHLFPHFFSENIVLKNIKTDKKLGLRIFNDNETKQCFLPKKHSVKDGKINPNFRVYFENVEMPAESILPKTELKKEDYGENHHLVPLLEFKNCEGVTVGETNTPFVIKTTDCRNLNIAKKQ